MLNMSKYDKIISKYQKSSDKVDFYVVYISEAHPTDGWDLFKDNYKIATHKNINHRINAVNLFIHEWKKIVNKTQNGKINCKIIIDNMNNEMRNKFDAFPERLYIIKNNKIEYVGKHGPFQYSVDPVLDYLESKNLS